jgi:adenylyltransferase/sulfurtransferase
MGQTPLSPDEIERYARHIVLREIGGPGQMQLKAARVLVIGAGGLGSPLLQYLASAGVGTIGIMDDDVVSLSNLQRQVLYGTADIGRPKVLSAADALHRLNPHVQVLPIQTRFGPESTGVLADYDIVVDGCDNFETRYCVADACATARLALITAAVGRFDGSITTLKPYATTPQGQPYPSYRDLFPAPPPAGSVPACAQAGVIGALTGIMGTMMAMEVIKEICGIGDSLAGRLLLVDALTMRFEIISYC